jgi:hypothetical protein
LEAGLDLEEYVIQVLEGKVGGVNGKSDASKNPSVSLDADRYSASAISLIIALRIRAGLSQSR